MKKISLLLSIIIFTIITFTYAQSEPNYNIKIPLKGESIASQRLQYDTLPGVISVASVYNKNCKSYSIPYTKLDFGIKEGVVKNNKYVEGYWQETWTVNRCSMKVDIPVMFVLDGKGGAYYIVHDEDVRYSKIKNK